VFVSESDTNHNQYRFLIRPDPEGRVQPTYVSRQPPPSSLPIRRHARRRPPPFPRSASERTQATAPTAKKMPGYGRVAARDELRSKTMDLAPSELSAPDPRQVLRKRLGEEMEALRGILRKAELVVRKNIDKGRAAPRRGKDGRFLAAEARSEAMEADRTPCAKRRKVMPPLEIIEPPPGYRSPIRMHVPRKGGRRHPWR